MGVLPRKWIRWIGIVLGVVAMLTPALLDLGWIPQTQALNAVIFLLGFLVLEAVTGEPSEQVEAPHSSTIP